MQLYDFAFHCVATPPVQPRNRSNAFPARGFGSGYETTKRLNLTNVGCEGDRGRISHAHVYFNIHAQYIFARASDRDRELLSSPGRAREAKKSEVD